MKSLLLIAVLAVSVSAQGLAQEAARISVTFATQDDDKAGTTQIVDHLVCGHHDVATLICCNANQDLDHWNVNTVTSRDMQIVEPFQKSRIVGCHFVFGMKPSGEETWKVIPSLTIYYNGSRVDWHFPYTALASNGKLTSRTFDLPTSEGR